MIYLLLLFIWSQSLFSQGREGYLDSLIVYDSQIKQSRRLGDLRGVKVMVMIRYGDCWTCIESIIQDILRYKMELNLEKNNLAIIVNEGNDEFLKFLRHRYGSNFYFYTANLQKVKTPSVFFREFQELVTIQPFIEDILSFSKLVDMFILKKKIK